MKIETIANRHIANKSELEKITLFFSRYKKGQWIYPGALKRKFDVTITEVYNLLLDMEAEGLVKIYYELMCMSCHKSTGETVEVFNQIPETIYCENCEQEVSGVENAVMIFRVVDI
ncbi:hypothetical protein ACR6HW_05090 [Fusibacter sp. JL298sf-3]